MKVCLINPNLVSLRADPFTTGIVYMPIELVYVATQLAQAGIDVQVIDSYGESPKQVRRVGNFILTGLPNKDILQKIDSRTNLFLLYADRVINYIALMELIRFLRKEFSKIPLVIFENAQAVTAYSLKVIREEFFSEGVAGLVYGDPERAILELVQKMEQGQKIQRLEIKGVENNLDQLPFPNWHYIPLDNYWRLRYAHGPFETEKYLPLLTSRGCPYPCNFCVIPATTGRQWRGRSAKNVVNEMENNMHRWGVREFHVEDVNPTVSDSRTREICMEIINRKLNVIWKLVSGTKVETIKDEETIRLLRRAGCTYISISPESGSTRVMKLIGKKFDFEHASHIIRAMNREGIVSQACFSLGHPGEKAEDLQLTKNAVRRLTRAGVDEITLPIITPIPGSKIYDQFDGFENYSQLNFTPTWRSDYPALNRFRFGLYARFILWKILFHPFKFLRQPISFFRRKFKTKMEMTPYRVLKTHWEILFSLH